MKIYKIKLADGDIIIYHSDKTLDELKEWITANDFIELPRSGTVPYGNNGWRSVPKLASYQTKSIVYIDHDTNLEEISEYNQSVINKNIHFVKEINSYRFNKCMNIWWFFKGMYWDKKDEKNCFYTEEFYKRVLDKIKKYKCKLK